MSLTDSRSRTTANHNQTIVRTPLVWPQHNQTLILGNLATNHNQTIVRSPGTTYQHNQTIVRSPGTSYQHNQTLVRR